MIVLTAHLQAKPGKEGEVESALTSLIPNAEGEPGTLQYILHRSQENVGEFFFYEKYADQAALDLHASSSFLHETLEKIGDLLAVPPKLSLYTEIASIRRQL